MLATTCQWHRMITTLTEVLIQDYVQENEIDFVVWRGAGGLNTITFLNLM
jgi:hypothetical protein